METNSNYYPCDIDSFDEAILLNGYSYFCRLSIDADMVENYDLLFEKYENYPNGYGWEGLIKTLIRETTPDIEKELNFDSEAGNFFCLISDEISMIKLATLISQMCANPDVMETMLSKVPNELRG